ncbi:hypothetical protein ALC62_12245 [Cyphomyrmex costatus]|uniref:Uncharacterized protein n=1 Tax=Cyphomyrmex costatus TaxID=456900 RepID=A0A195C8I8_9HYME|nr:hypothetical protein ALC62_12245 [Cyphomyrmex costatus]
MALTLPPTFAAEIREIVLTYDAVLAKGYNTPPRLVL